MHDKHLQGDEAESGSSAASMECLLSTPSALGCCIVPAATLTAHIVQCHPSCQHLAEQADALLRLPGIPPHPSQGSTSSARGPTSDLAARKWSQPRPDTISCSVQYTAPSTARVALLGATSAYGPRSSGSLFTSMAPGR